MNPHQLSNLTGWSAVADLGLKGLLLPPESSDAVKSAQARMEEYQG